MLSLNLKNNFRRLAKTQVAKLPKVLTSRFSTLRDLEVLQTKVDKQSQEFQVSKQHFIRKLEIIFFKKNFYTKKINIFNLLI
jgi:NurA-like 5'-3' nuclease